MGPEIIVAVALLALAGWITQLWHRRRLARVKIEEERVSALNLLVQKAGSAEEVAAILRSDAGRRAFVSPADRASPVRSVLRFLQLGVAALVIGGAMFHSAHRLDAFTDVNSVHQAMDLRWWGELVVGGGLASLVVALITFVAGRSLHVIDGAARRDREPGPQDR